MKQLPQASRTAPPLTYALALLLIPVAGSCSSNEGALSAGQAKYDITQIVQEPGLPEPGFSVHPVQTGVEQRRGVIDIAIGLDTSGSMDGLLDSARQTLWSIVNDLALIEPAPDLRVALLTFGNDNHLEENGWVHLDVPLTNDLDEISEKLFALSTNGGTEFVGRVVDAATRDLDWSREPNALKLLVVAGNESADQDTLIRYQVATKAAITAGILVNSIYCGDPADALSPAWREVALLADGHYASIDKDNGMVVIVTPFDGQLATLTTSVNETYIPLGQDGLAGQLKQSVQDGTNFALNNEAAVGRIMTKNTSLYVCGWDLVDATHVNKVKLEDVERSSLPEELQKLSDEELAAHVKSMWDKRESIKKEIAQIGSQRTAWLAEEWAKNDVDDSKALDRVMRDAIRVQAGAKGFKFKGDKPAEEADSELQSREQQSQAQRSLMKREEF